jgi:hypothetical protein
MGEEVWRAAEERDGCRRQYAAYQPACLDVMVSVIGRTDVQRGTTLRLYPAW